VRLAFVERVSKVLPQEHFTVATTYSGWMSARMAISVLLLLGAW
jgi:hypothetical protein